MNDIIAREGRMARFPSSGLRVALVATAMILAAPSIANAAPGDLDPTFSGDGVAEFRVGTYSGGVAVSIQGDGNIVAAGYGGNFTGFAIVRTLAGGTLDPTFGGDGRVITRIGHGGAVANAVAVQPNGKLLVAGSTVMGGKERFAVARYLDDGSLDVGFGDGGIVVTSFAAYAAIDGLGIQPDGKIVAVGYRGSDIALVRYTHNGRLDKTFSRDGKLTMSVGKQAGATSVVVQPDGKIVVAGYAYRISTPSAYDIDFVVTRHRPHGRLDEGFGEGGIKLIDLSGTLEVAADVGLQPDGKIVIAGESGEHEVANATSSSTLIRLDTDGTLDPTFSGDGWVKNDFGTAVAAASGMELRGDGAIVTTGRAGNEAGGHLVVARYTPDGTRDATFGTNGHVITEVARTGYDVALQLDGNIVVTGRPVKFERFFLARFLGG
jgi:uncharacterized delta-60 repeat protein